MHTDECFWGNSQQSQRVVFPEIGFVRERESR
jgi:hypothetical protein